MDMKCVICGKVTRLKCQRCGESYCSEVCQTKDWQRHKFFCISMPPLVAYNDIRTPVATQSFVRYYFKDVKRQLIPLGDNVNVILLSAQGMRNTGYVTGVHFKDEKEAESLQNILTLVASHGECDHNAVDNYVPCIGEICLARFNEDKTWYRGVCQEIKDDQALILYYDFGNSEYVNFKDLKPTSSKLLHDIHATKCYIEGFDKTQNFKYLEEYLNQKSKFNCTVMEGPENDTRLIRIPHLKKILKL